MMHVVSILSQENQVRWCSNWKDKSCWPKTYLDPLCVSKLSRRNTVRFMHSDCHWLLSLAFTINSKVIDNSDSGAYSCFFIWQHFLPIHQAHLFTCKDVDFLGSNSLSNLSKERRAQQAHLVTHVWITISSCQVRLQPFQDIPSQLA